MQKMRLTFYWTGYAGEGEDLERSKGYHRD